PDCSAQLHHSIVPTASDHAPLGQCLIAVGGVRAAASTNERTTPAGDVVASACNCRIRAGHGYAVRITAAHGGVLATRIVVVTASYGRPGIGSIVITTSHTGKKLG